MTRGVNSAIRETHSCRNLQKAIVMTDEDINASGEAQDTNNENSSNNSHQVGLQGMDLYGSDNYQEAVRFLETLYGRCSDDLLAVITHAAKTEQAFGFGDDREVVIDRELFSESRSIGGPEQLAARTCRLGTWHRRVDPGLSGG